MYVKKGNIICRRHMHRPVNWSWLRTESLSTIEQLLTAQKACYWYMKCFSFQQVGNVLFAIFVNGCQNISRYKSSPHPQGERLADETWKTKWKHHEGQCVDLTFLSHWTVIDHKYTNQLLKPIKNISQLIVRRQVHL